jgi:hypothetical protein
LNSRNSARECLPGASRILHKSLFNLARDTPITIYQDGSLPAAKLIRQFTLGYSQGGQEGEFHIEMEPAEKGFPDEVVDHKITVVLVETAGGESQ